VASVFRFPPMPAHQKTLTSAQPFHFPIAAIGCLRIPEPALATVGARACDKQTASRPSSVCRIHWRKLQRGGARWRSHSLTVDYESVRSQAGAANFKVRKPKEKSGYSNEAREPPGGNLASPDQACSQGHKVWRMAEPRLGRCIRLRWSAERSGPQRLGPRAHLRAELRIKWLITSVQSLLCSLSKMNA
jgi:hypothetical protein